MRRVALAALLAGAVPAPLGGQGDVASQLAGRAPPAVIATVQQLADSAAVLGLPINPLIQKALEGGAKGIPDDRVLAAVRAVLTQLHAAAVAIRAAGVAAPDGETIEAGAFALNAGLGDRQVQDLVRASISPPYVPAATLRIAGTLAALGVPPKETVDLVRASIRAGRPPAELLNLPSRVQESMARGIPPAEAAAGLARAAGQAPARQPHRPPPGQGRPRRP